MGKGDNTLDMFGWAPAAAVFDSLYNADRLSTSMPANAPIVIDKWFPGAHLEYYFAQRTNQRIIGMGSLADLGQYYWSNKYELPLRTGDSAYYIIPSNLFEHHAFETITSQFNRFDIPLVIRQTRNNLPCKTYYVFRLKGFIPSKAQGENK